MSARGNERFPAYRDDGGRHRFLELVATVRGRYRWRVFSYYLMTNHYHLLVQTSEPNLARGMRQLNGVYARWFNRRHGRVGHLFQGRYGARLVQADEHLLAAVRSIVRNPVRAGLCRAPEEWRWSSHRIAPAPEVPRRYLQPPRPQLAHPLASPDLAAAAAAAHAHGYSLRGIDRHLDTHASTLSRRLRRHQSGSAAATNGT